MNAQSAPSLARTRWLRLWLAWLVVQGVACELEQDPGDASTPSATPLPDPAFVLPTAGQTSRSTLAVADAFPNLRFSDPVAMTFAGSRVFVVERAGRVYAFANRQDVEDRTLVLDISTSVGAAHDSGMLAIALHPEWEQPESPNRAYFYVYYARVDEPLELEPEPNAWMDHQVRLSRFTLGESGTASPDSELVLIEQEDRNLWHQGGGLLFNPHDGFLYLSIGDEGSNDCAYGNCQRIDRSLFGGVLRIDVDMRGGEISHPIRTRPERGTTDHYFIPSDNPFVDEPDVLEELYAIGLRNPYRMSYDPVDDVTFVTDVGEIGREELDVLAPAANFQWNVMEGDQPARKPPEVELPRLGVWTDPVWSHPHVEVRVIVGGLVYRGAQVPSLYGRYLHADFRLGNVFALRYVVREGEVGIEDAEVVLETDFADLESGITAFAEGDEGELYFLTLGQDVRIRRIEEDPIYAEDVPRRLSQTHLFRDLRTLSPAGALIEYEVNVPLWSDGARKRRFLALPPGQRARAGESRSWDLPEGTVLVKHFELALDERQPERVRRLETRVLTVGPDGVHGATYRWREDGEDADLLLEHVEEELRVTEASGATRTHVHVYPSPQECLRCHNARAGDALGISTRQLDGAARGDDQLKRLIDAGIVERAGLREDGARSTPLAALDDDSAPLERRVRSYLDANCAFCHGTLELHGVSWDARIETPLGRAGILDAPVRNGMDAQRIIEPGAPQRSALFLRASSELPGTRMPPLATTRPDPAFVARLAEWIESP